ncbi:hypothetical protein GW916_11000 [bacterium]|nr:hypothetical protein [bacterium]
MRFGLELKTTFVSFLLLSSIHSGAWGNTKSTSFDGIAAVDTGQVLHENDPYSIQYKISEPSKFAGQIIEVDRFRHPIIVQETDDFIEFANYLHEGKYYIARIFKVSQVEAAYAHIVKFAAVPGVTAAHTQYRVVFAPGSEIELRSQRTGESEELKVNDIVISSEAARPEGFPYEFNTGLFPNYAVIKRALSGVQRAKESIENKTEQYKILLPSEGLLQMVLNSIHEGHKERASRFYGTIARNCTTDLFVSIDKILTAMGRIFKTFKTVLSLDPIATPTREALRERGVLGPRVANLEREIFHGELDYVPSDEDKPKPIGVFPERLASQFSLVIHIPNEENLNQDQLDTIKTVRAEFSELVSEVVQSALATSSLGSDSGQEALRNGLLSVTKALQEFLSEWDKKIPEGMDQKLMIYFVPYVGSPSEDITEQLTEEYPARLPIKAFKGTVNSERNDLFQVQMAPKKVRLAFLEESQRKETELRPLHLSGLAAQVHLKRGSSSAKLQILGGLNPSSHVLVEEQGPIRLFSVNTVDPELSPTSNTSMLTLNLEVKAADGSIPQLRVEFGRDQRHQIAPRGVVPNMNMEANDPNYGLFNLAEGRRGAGRHRLLRAPYFFGEEVYMGIDIRFPILNFSLDLETFKIENLDMRIFKPTLGLTLKMKMVNSKFQKSLNSKIKSIMDKVKADGGTGLLNQLFGRVGKASNKVLAAKTQNCESHLKDAKK